MKTTHNQERPRPIKVAPLGILRSDGIGNHNQIAGRDELLLHGS